MKQILRVKFVAELNCRFILLLVRFFGYRGWASAYSSVKLGRSGLGQAQPQAISLGNTIFIKWNFLYANTPPPPPPPAVSCRAGKI